MFSKNIYYSVTMSELWGVLRPKSNLEMSPFFAEKLTYWWLGYLPDEMNGMQSETVERNFPHLHNNGP